jgi:hypothetical protein
MIAPVALALVLAGCGGSSKSSDKANTVAPTPTTSTATTPTTTTPPVATSTDAGTPNQPSTTPGTGGTPSPGGSSGNGGGTGGVYPNQPAPSQTGNPNDRFKQYCAQNPHSCGD